MKCENSSICTTVNTIQEDTASSLPLQEVAWNYGATFSVRESSHTGTNYLRMWSRQTLWIHSRIGWTRSGAFKVQRTSQPVINKYKYKYKYKNVFCLPRNVTLRMQCATGFKDKN